MRKALIRIFLISLLCLPAARAEEAVKTPANATTLGLTNRPTKSVKVIYKKSESHQFSGTELKGKLKKPELSYIYERKGMKEERIVDIPENFNNEIIDGAGQL